MACHALLQIMRGLVDPLYFYFFSFSLLLLVIFFCAGFKSNLSPLPFSTYLIFKFFIPTINKYIYLSLFLCVSLVCVYKERTTERVEILKKKLYLYLFTVHLRVEFKGRGDLCGFTDELDRYTFPLYDSPPPFAFEISIKENK